jgi:hypothetical protein
MLLSECVSTIGSEYPVCVVPVKVQGHCAALMFQEHLVPLTVQVRVVPLVIFVHVVPMTFQVRVVRMTKFQTHVVLLIPMRGSCDNLYVVW